MDRCGVWRRRRLDPLPDMRQGDRVTAGQALVVLEAMKMEHTVAAPLDGVLTALHVQPGDQVESGQALAVVEEAG